ncbi:hypothetical protein ACFRMQ_22480 [Kitasatospora sp. NPDC056783]|uniref:hypothetical protein n=1 Tax=Kitasatospora sp. NPDC056783 TaxID=3345943 RepID=UPI0036976D3F
MRTSAPCASGPETAVSPAFAAAVLLSPSSPAGEAVILPTVAPGSYPITATCGGVTVAVGTVTIAPATALPAGGGWGADRDDVGPAVAAVAAYGVLALTGGVATVAALRRVRRRIGRRAVSA